MRAREGEIVEKERQRKVDFIKINDGRVKEQPG